MFRAIAVVRRALARGGFDGTGADTLVAEGGAMKAAAGASTSVMSLKSESLALDRTSMRDPLFLGCKRLAGVSENAFACRSRSMSSTFTGPRMVADMAGGDCWACCSG